VFQKINDISSLSLYDYASITGNYLCIIRNEKDHEQRLKTRGYSKAQLDAIEKNKSKRSQEFLGLRFTRSLTKFHYAALNYVTVLFDNYEKGNLPFEGCVTEQPAQIMEIFSLIKAIRIEHQIENEKAQKQSQQRRK
jgi:hypothetical protein